MSSQEDRETPKHRSNAPLALSAWPSLEGDFALTALFFPSPVTIPPPTHELLDDITFTLAKYIIQTEWLKIEMLTWS